MDRPKPAPNASSSDDLAQARQASQRLRAGQRTDPAAGEQGYVSLGARGPVPPPPRIATPVPPAPRPSVPLMTRRQALRAPAAGFGPDAWNALLDAALSTVNGEAAVLMSPNGLIIASRGPRAGDELEAVGARLMVAFEQADRIDGEHATLSMSMEMPRGTLHGVRLAQPDGGFLTMGLLISRGLTAERQGRLLALLASLESK
jgi:predicted regulator of Ras-like GTPase activity (Roadblock/LC7/MglB family)